MRRENMRFVEEGIPTNILALNRKEELLAYIKGMERCRTKDIRVKFGNGGHIWTTLDQLEYDGYVSKPEKGIWKAV